jgi:hypothetical protein
MTQNLCRFCTGEDIAALAKTYAGVVVGDLESKVLLCEAEFAACCTTWCVSCEKVSVVCLQPSDDETNQSEIKHSAIIAQIALWQQVCAL